MANIEDQRKRVIATFFDPYVGMIHSYADTLKRDSLGLIAVTYLSGAAEFYGFLLRLEEKDPKAQHKKGQTPDNFYEFGKVMLGVDEKILEGIYKIFRSGAGHQIYPKAAWVEFNENRDDLLYISQDYPNNSDLPVLNVSQYQKLILGAVKRLELEVRTGELSAESFIRNVDSSLLYNSEEGKAIDDGLGDFKQLDQYWKYFFADVPNPRGRQWNQSLKQWEKDLIGNRDEWRK